MTSTGRAKGSLEARLSAALPDHKFSIERRRYGNTTYTWAYVQYEGEKLSLGDPWPCVTPAVAELAEAATRVINREKTRWLESLRPGTPVEVLWDKQGWLSGAFEALQAHPDPGEDVRRVHVKMDNGLPCVGTGFHPLNVRAMAQSAG